MAVDEVFITPKVEITQWRYEELVQAELKAKQYKDELKRLGEFDYLINIIEASVENEEENKEEEN